jgi:type I pantothenate kinase
MILACDAALNSDPMSDPVFSYGSGHSSPFIELTRSDWAELAVSSPLSLQETEIAQLRGLGEPLDLQEINDVYVPLSRLLNLYVIATKQLHKATGNFLGEKAQGTPFVIGIAGSVAVGKSTIARLLRELLARGKDTPRVELVTTDGFLFPNAELARQGILERKGFPESYDRQSLLRFVTEVKSGTKEVQAPIYSHISYDIVPDAHVIVHHPDILIIEGLNVLQPPASGHRLAVSDLFDFTIYVDARTKDIARWYEERFLTLQKSAFSDPKSYFHKFVSLNEDAARSCARHIWHSINEPNLMQNIRPTRSRARLILHKDTNHAVSRVLVRKL